MEILTNEHSAVSSFGDFCKSINALNEADYKAVDEFTSKAIVK